MRMFITLIALLFSAHLFAETIKIPVGSQGQAVEKPRLGSTMSTVKSAYGEPSRVSGPVGEPPITRWDYPGFSVYFEHDSVLHSVVRHQANASGQATR